MKNTLHLWFIKGKKISNVSNLARSSPYHVTSLVMQPLITLNYAYTESKFLKDLHGSYTIILRIYNKDNGNRHAGLLRSGFMSSYYNIFSGLSALHCPSLLKDHHRRKQLVTITINFN
jgi:hypothetical protein